MTAEKHEVSLLNLPTELLHRICDFLDAQTILLSFRHVCTQLLASTQTYNRYKIHINSMSSINMCRIISPDNIVSLDFKNDNSANNQLEYFLSICDIQQFTRLHSLSIYNSSSSDIMSLLSFVIRQSSLHNLRLNFDLIDKEKFLWSNQCAIRNLSFGTCTFKQFCSIIQHSPYLHTLSINSCQRIDIDNSFFSQSYQQLNSLTLNDMQMTMDKLEFFLSFLPSLIHLDLTSSGKPFEFVQRLSRWEDFIPLRLPRLRQLEFCIFCYCLDWTNFDAFISAFRTPFWLEEKQWFVTCQFRDDWTSSFTIFTSPPSSIECNGEKYNFDRIVCSKAKIEYQN